MNIGCICDSLAVIPDHISVSECLHYWCRSRRDSVEKSTPSHLVHKFLVLLNGRRVVLEVCKVPSDKEGGIKGHIKVVTDKYQQFHML